MLVILFAILIQALAIAPLRSLSGFQPKHEVTLHEFSPSSGTWQEVSKLQNWPQFYPANEAPFWVAEILTDVFYDSATSTFVVPVSVHLAQKPLNDTTWFVFFDQQTRAYASLHVPGTFFGFAYATNGLFYALIEGNPFDPNTKQFIVPIHLGSSPSLGPIVTIGLCDGQRLPPIIDNPTFNLKSSKLILSTPTITNHQSSSLYHVDPTTGKCTTGLNLTAIWPGSVDFPLLSLPSQGSNVAMLTGPKTRQLEAFHLLDINTGNVQGTTHFCDVLRFPEPLFASDRTSGTGYWVGDCNPPQNIPTLIVFDLNNKVTSYTLNNETQWDHLTLIDTY